MFAAFRRVLLFTLLAGVCLGAEPVSFVRVWPGWKDADAFDTIGEYFTGREEHARRVVLRTHSDTRAGFYFLVRVNNPAAPIGGAIFNLHLIRPGSPNAKVFTFSAAVPSGQSVYQLGLTGPDWPDEAMHPVAWRLDLTDTEGKLLTHEQSFLWSKPSK